MTQHLHTVFCRVLPLHSLGTSQRRCGIARREIGISMQHVMKLPSDYVMIWLVKQEECWPVPKEPVEKGDRRTEFCLGVALDRRACQM